MPWKLFFVGVLLGSLAFQTFITNADPADALPVAFMTQFDGSAYAPTDCGPASVAMAINYATGEHVKPLEVRQAIAKFAGYAANPGSGTAVGDLARIARAHGVDVFMGDGAASVGWGPERIRKHLLDGHPVIVLTRLAYLPGYAPTSQIDHYILLTGATATGYVYNDPGQSSGYHRTISEKQLQLAQRATSVPGQGIALNGPAPVEPPKPAGPTFTIKVKPGDTLSQIAEKFKLSMRDVADMNRLVNVNHIEVGQELMLPGDEAEAPTVADAPAEQDGKAPAKQDVGVKAPGSTAKANARSSGWVFES